MSSIQKIRRMLSLVERLQSGRSYTTAELTVLLGISRRTFFRDLKDLQSAGIEILYDTATQGYWIPIHHALPPTQLTLAETLALIVLAKETEESGRSLPFLDAARDASLKLQSSLPSHLAEQASRLSERVAVHAEPTGHTASGRPHYERLLEGATTHRKVRGRYFSFADGTEIQTLLSPYRMLFRRHAWYVIGRSSIHRAVRTFHVGRFSETELTNEQFAVPPRFTLRRYFGNAWSLIRESNAREEVTVRFQPLVAKNVAEVAWHPTQQLKWNDDGTLDFTVTVDGIHEMSWWILSYGNQAKVLKPASLQKLIADRAREMVAQYADDTATSEPAPPRRKRSR